jgi:hypothetical protein
MTRRTHNRALKQVDLSIDFDFFARELIEWDWGHGDTALFATMIWSARYASSVDVHAETDPAHWADFRPVDLIEVLERRGLRMAPPSDRPAMFWVSESHRALFTRLQGMPAPDVLLHMDAHHDCWPYPDRREPDGVSCGNWLTALLRRQQWRNVEVIYTRPSWKEERERRCDGKLHTTKVREVVFSDWPGFEEPVQVRNIFLCRSAPWVPPHLDEQFLDLAAMLAQLRGSPRGAGRIVVWPPDLLDRSTLVVTPEDSRAMRESLEYMKDSRIRRLHDATP